MNKNKLARYLFYYKHTICGSIDIEDDISNLCEYMLEFENIDFNQWLVENDLFKQYMEFIRFI